MISALSLIVAALAVLFGPLVSWVIAGRANAITSREAWVREFRDNVAALLTAYDAFVIFCSKYSSEDPTHQAAMERLTDSQRLPYHKIRLLIVSHNGLYPGFLEAIEAMLSSSSDKAASRRNQVVEMAGGILQREHALITEIPDIWPAILASITR